jgi:hypothetical protein
MNERLDRFTKLLKEIFELDKSDLDFGIYRVMNLRKAQIEQFLTERLPKMVQETLAPFAQGSKEEIRAKMKQIEESVAEMGMTVDALPNTAQKKQQYLQLQKQLAEGADLAALETDVYSALYSFFNDTTRTAILFPSAGIRKASTPFPTRVRRSNSTGQIRISTTSKPAKISKITPLFSMGSTCTSG